MAKSGPREKSSEDYARDERCSRRRRGGGVESGDDEDSMIDRIERHWGTASPSYHDSRSGHGLLRRRVGVSSTEE